MPTSANRRPGLNPWLIFGLWTIPTLFSTLETVVFARMADRPMPVYRAFIAEAPQWYAWAVFTPAILWLGDRFPLGWPPRARNIAVHILASLSFSLVAAATVAGVNVFVRPSRLGFLGSARSWFLSGLPATTLAYMAILILGFAVLSATRLRERETQLREAQLAALRMQIQPHFLFNSLNAIMALVRDRETEQAVRALSLLGDVLRATVNAGDSQTTSLRQELDFVGRYLEIERVRFGDRLKVDIDVPAGVLDATVPTFILQPFVENSLKHGVLREREGNNISIRSRNTGGSLTLVVRDDGRGLTNGTSGGVGISNARARLDRLYGGAARLDVRNANPGVEVEITIPRA